MHTRSFRPWTVPGCRLRLALVAQALLLLVATSALADWDEGVDGDLSTNEAAPTPLALVVGSNVIAGSVVSPGDVRDYVTFTVGPGQQLTALNQLAYFDIPGGGPGNRGYHAINAGATSFIPSAGNSSSFLGGNHLDPLPPGTDMLPGLAAAPLAGVGFTVPLGPGTYSYLVQQTGPQQNGYELELVIVSTATPGLPLLSTEGVVVLLAILIGLGVFAVRRRRGSARYRSEW
jgi:hypothetical protein